MSGTRGRGTSARTRQALTAAGAATPGVRHDQRAPIIRQRLEVDGVRVQVAEPGGSHRLLGHAGRERHGAPAALLSGGAVVAAGTAYVRGVGQHAPRDVLEPVPLLHEVVAASVTRTLMRAGPRA